MTRKKISVLVILAVFMMLVVSVPTAKAQFVIAGLWDFHDEYGQGIKLFHFYENSTGSWVEKYSVQGFKPTNESAIIEWDGGISIKLRCQVYINSTFLGLGSVVEGLNYIRLSVTVITLNEIVFSQCNFTSHSYGTVGAIYSYSQDVVLNFIPQSGQIYTVTVTFEVFY